MKYVFSVCPYLFYVIFRFCKFIVPVLRFGVTDYPGQYVSVLFVLWLVLLKYGITLRRINFLPI